MGSGITLKNAIEKYGKENFKKEIIEECSSKEELDKREIYWINYYNAVQSTQFYNISKGGDGYNPMCSGRCVYCIDLKQAFTNSNVAEKITNENASTIYNRCKNQDMKIKKGYRYCFIEDMYKYFDIKISHKSKPVIYLYNNKIYGNITQLNKIEGHVCARRMVMNIERYNHFIEKGKDISNKAMYLEDYLKIFEYTEKITESLDLSTSKKA